MFFTVLKVVIQCSVTLVKQLHNLISVPKEQAAVPQALTGFLSFNTSCAEFQPQKYFTETTCPIPLRAKEQP